MPIIASAETSGPRPVWPETDETIIHEYYFNPSCAPEGFELVAQAGEVVLVDGWPVGKITRTYKRSKP